MQIDKLSMTLIAAFGLAAGVTTQESGQIATNAAGGAAIGALAGAALVGADGNRSDAALRGALGGAAVGSLVGYGDVRQQREREQAARAAQAEAAARQYGATRCTSLKQVDAYGHVPLTQRCTSNVERPGYQSF